MPTDEEQYYRDELNALRTQPPIVLPARARSSPDDGTRPGWFGLLGEALGGGQAPGYRLRGREEGAAGSRALLNFGINMLLASGPARVKPDLLSAAATGLQGAQQSIGEDQQRAAAGAAADYRERLDQAKLAITDRHGRIEQLKAMIPLLQMQRVQANPPPWGTPAATGTPAPPVDKATFLQQTAKRESGGDPTVLNYVAQQDPTAYDRGATASGKYQIVNSTWREGMQLAGLDPSKYATARDAPEAVQDQVASAIYDKYGAKPWQKGAKDWVKDERGQYQLATIKPSAPVPAAQPTGVQVAGPGAPTGTAPPPAPTPPAADPASFEAFKQQNLRGGPDLSDLERARSQVQSTYSQATTPAEQATAVAKVSEIDNKIGERKAAWEKDQTDRLFKVWEADRTQQRAIAMENLKGEQTRLTNRDAVFNAANQKGLERTQKEHGDSSNIVSALEGFRAISNGVGQPGWMQTTRLPGSDQTIAERLQQAGIKMDDTAGVQLLRGGMAGLVKSLREGMAMGSMSDRDLDFISRLGPTEWMDKDTRNAAISYLEQAHRAKMRFTADVEKEMSRGKNYGDAVDTANGKMKPFVPAVDAELSANWTNQAPEWVQRRKDWARRNDVKGGTMFHLNDGSILVMPSR